MIFSNTHKRSNQSSKGNGFTLLEVMVALLVIAVSLGGAVKVIGNAANNSSRMSDKTFANWVALNKIAELRILKEWPRIGEYDGDTEMAGRKWQWKQKTIKTDDDNIKRVEVSVWDIRDKKSDPFVTVVGFLAKP